jgi:glutamyl/glutaminyl-tRNA synthetase
MFCNALLDPTSFRCVSHTKQQDNLGRCAAGCQDLDILPVGNNLRINLPVDNRDFTDRVYGHIESERLTFDNAIIWRKDDLPAYLLAATVDDIDSGVTDIVRGDDLLFETHRQLAFYAVLKKDVPRYAHIPVVRNDDGKKLSKQTGAEGIDINNPIQNLAKALVQLHPEFKFSNESTNPSDWLRSLQDHWYLPTKSLQT